MGTQLFNVNILSENEQTGGRGAFRVSFTIDNADEVKKNEQFRKKFDEFYKKLYVDLIIEIHRYLIRLTPLHTGQLRGGWTAFLNKHQADYSKQIKDTSLYASWKNANKTPEYKTYAVDSAAIAAGVAKSGLEDNLPNDTDVSVNNGVEYKDYLDFGTSEIPGRHFTDVARYKGEYLFEKMFNEWLKKMEDAGAIVPPPSVPEIGV